MKTVVRMLAIAVMVLSGGLAAEADGPLSQVTALSLGTRAHDIALAEVDGQRFAYIATDDGMTIVEITTPEAPIKKGSIDLGGKSLGITVRHPLAFVANQTTDFKIVSVANPDAPVLLASKSISGSAWDVAVKDDVAYVTSFGGEMYLFRIPASFPAAIQQIRVIGLIAWTNPGQDAANLAKLRNLVSSGSAKATGVSVTGNTLVAVDWNYGRIYYYDVADADSPVFRGTHYAPFTFRPAVNPDETAVFALAAFGNSSGVYSATLGNLGPTFSTTHSTCSGCDYFKSPATDYGGLTVSSNGKYVVYIAGKKGVVQVLNASAADLTSAGSLPIGTHGMKTGESMGVQTLGKYIYAAAGLLGLLVFEYLGLSD